MQVRTGDTVSQLLEVMQQVGATEVLCESEVEYRWLQLQEKVESGATPTIPGTQAASAQGRAAVDSCIDRCIKSQCITHGVHRGSSSRLRT